MNDTWTGMYDYKGFTIWSPSEKYWIAEPNWSVEALENYKASEHNVEHKTIAKAKTWINKYGVKLNEEDFKKV